MDGNRVVQLNHTLIWKATGLGSGSGQQILFGGEKDRLYTPPIRLGC